MSTADVAIIANAIVDLAAVGTAWNLIRSGKVRLSAPSTAQIQAEQQPGQQSAQEAAGPSELDARRPAA